MEYNTYDNLNSSLYDPEMDYYDYDYSNWTEIVDFLISVIPNFTVMIIYNVILFTICFLGLLGNGKVIWILGFHMKRNSFSIYVLNLAVADCGVLMLKVVAQICQILHQELTWYYILLLLLHYVSYNTSQLLLISISVDRCVSVLFPIWHQCRRPPKLSFIVCVITWVVPFVWTVLGMVFGVSIFLLKSEWVFSALISYPMVVISTLILLVKVFFKQRQQKRKKVLTVTLLALLCFIVLRLAVTISHIILHSLPNNSLLWLTYQLHLKSTLENETMGDNFLQSAYGVLPWIQYLLILDMVSNICVTVNSSINPILYFLAGRNKDSRSRVSMKVALRRVFRNEEDANEDVTQPEEIPL